ncbi:glycosyltransferase family 25 protein [Sporomusa termitida]|uniref:Glycosyltransferase family 25 (LPS biosynthesis protein) n=1 Tax=Sporomusa termitida TaxID=2377 RepID=A0A517DXF5_9FIRM|nr:glycosyltransferase family 25 protein [Sporomusa termitida]QDR82045.1 Glycosyltransferase family 25 (LPS biosynthesis protein) [Sporomusa termitida]
MHSSNVICILINLDRSPERLLQMQQRLSRLNLPFQRCVAIDGGLVNFSEKEINADEYERCHGKYVTTTEVACYISHYRALEMFVASDKEFALILEDDMEFSNDFPLVLNDLTTNHDNWDMIKFNGTSNWAVPVTKKKLIKDYRLIFNFLHQAKAGAYLLNRYAAISYLDKMLPMTVPIDHEFLKFWKYGIKIFTVLPFPAWESGAESTINYAMVGKNRKKWYKRWSCYSYRLQIAMQRIYHGYKL